MTVLATIKTQLIDVLWLPKVDDFANREYPRRRRNKDLRLLTLTNDKNYDEIIRMEESNITKREKTVAWTNSHIVGWRLDTILGRATVARDARFETCAGDNFLPIHSHFPFDILNIDFSSQNIESSPGRLEREIDCLEKTISIQKQKDIEKFVLLYTTVLNGCSVSYSHIVTTSNSVIMFGWEGLKIDEFSPELNDHDEMGQCIESVISKLTLKYAYQSSIDRVQLPIPLDSREVLSVVALVKR